MKGEVSSENPRGFWGLLSEWGRLGPRRPSAVLGGFPTQEIEPDMLILEVPDRALQVGPSVQHILKQAVPAPHAVAEGR